jgi:type IV fimbrial biogenesis protein FimT
MRELARGVTLLELLTAIAVLGVLTAVGVPAFQNIMRNNQISAGSSNLVMALSLARSEAVKRGMRVSVCAAATAANTCAAGPNWANGWLVFVDDFGGLGTVDANDEPLQSWPGPSPGVVVNTAAQSVTFNRRGRAAFARSFNLLKSGCTGDQQRVINIALSGRVSLTKIACPVI